MTTVHKFVSACAVLGMFAAHAAGGVVSFNPNVQSVEVNAPDMTVAFHVVIESAAASQISVAVLWMGSDDLQMVDFTLHPDFTNAFMLTVADPLTSQYYNSDLRVQGAAFYNPPANLSLAVGTLTVDAAGLGSGTYQVMVDSDIDGDHSFVEDETRETEGLWGIGTVEVTPEPASLALLALGVLAFFRRR